MPALLAENVLAFLIERALRRQVRWYRRKFSVLICVSCTYKDFFIFRSLILAAVLLAAGAVLKFFAGSVINIGGMKPNFIIAMYCLAILLIRPSLTALALHVGSVFQDIDSQMVAGQVEDEILFGLENFGVDRAEIPRRIDEALDDVGIAPLRHRAIDSLSGIMEAQTARGVAFDTKNPFKKLGLILPLCMPLLISSVGRIHDTAAAAEMRGFTLRTRESQSRRYTFKSGDLFAALIAAALVAVGALL